MDHCRDRLLGLPHHGILDLNIAAADALHNQAVENEAERGEGGDDGIDQNFAVMVEVVPAIGSL